MTEDLYKAHSMQGGLYDESQKIQVYMCVDQGGEDRFEESAKGEADIKQNHTNAPKI